MERKCNLQEFPAESSPSPHHFSPPHLPLSCLLAHTLCSLSAVASARLFFLKRIPPYHSEWAPAVSLQNNFRYWRGDVTDKWMAVDAGWLIRFNILLCTEWMIQSGACTKCGLHAKSWQLKLKSVWIKSKVTVNHFSHADLNWWSRVACLTSVFWVQM